ncbi:MAG: hypothetical protein BWY76_02561 [bacterium ADurb.Bin429]|nr:MAG: hypothetical protein BWY76_02561 [bacterium ADurb.Bin429]
MHGAAGKSGRCNRHGGICVIFYHHRCRIRQRHRVNAENAFVAYTFRHGNRHRYSARRGGEVALRAQVRYVYRHQAGVLAHQVVIKGNPGDLFDDGYVVSVYHLHGEIVNLLPCPDLRKHVVLAILAVGERDVHAEGERIPLGGAARGDFSRPAFGILAEEHHRRARPQIGNFTRQHVMHRQPAPVQLDLRELRPVHALYGVGDDLLGVRI